MLCLELPALAYCEYMHPHMCRTPVEVLQDRYGTICKILAHKLSVYEMSNLTPLLKYVSLI